MKASVLRTTKRKGVGNDRSLGVQLYGEDNAYPQKVMDIVAGSGTGSACLAIYRKFLFGKGFDVDAVVNSRGQTLNYVLQQACADWATFNGFALHINYNRAGHGVELSHIPFEHVRFKKLDADGEFDQVAVHPDWARQFTNLRRFNKNDIQFLDLFDPGAVRSQASVAGGWNSYKGQVLYVSGAGDKTYPLPRFDSELTNMNTEEGIGNVLNRNTRNGFRPAAMLVDKRNPAETEGQRNDLLESLLEFQQDENTAKMMYLQVDSEAEIPQIVPFDTNNFDKDLSYTADYVKGAIGRVFNQPPILRSEDVGSNFGADAIRNAYNFYNSVTEGDRMLIASNFETVLRLMPAVVGLPDPLEIEPLTYSYGSTNIRDIPPEFVAVMTTEEKRDMLGLSN